MYIQDVQLKITNTLEGKISFHILVYVSVEANYLSYLDSTQNDYSNII